MRRLLMLLTMTTITLSCFSAFAQLSAWKIGLEADGTWATEYNTFYSTTGCISETGNSCRLYYTTNSSIQNLATGADSILAGYKNTSWNWASEPMDWDYVKDNACGWYGWMPSNYTLWVTWQTSYNVYWAAESDGGERHNSTGYTWLKQDTGVENEGYAYCNYSGTDAIPFARVKYRYQGGSTYYVKQFGVFI